jgi:hypothetical protein
LLECWIVKIFIRIIAKNSHLSAQMAVFFIFIPSKSLPFRFAECYHLKPIAKDTATF